MTTSLFITTSLLTFLILVSSTFQQSGKKFHSKMQKSIFFHLIHIANQ